MAVGQVDRTLHGQLLYVPPMQMDQLVVQVLGEVTNSSLVMGPNTWLQRVLQACKQTRQSVSHTSSYTQLISQNNYGLALTSAAHHHLGWLTDCALH